MGMIRSVFLSTLAFCLLTAPGLLQAQAALQLVPVAPCRLIDTRTTGGPITGGTARTFNLVELAQAAGCASLSSASAYSLNVTVVPSGRLGFLTIWPDGEARPTVSLMNSLDGRTKANATIVGAGTGGAVDVYVSNTANVLLDIDGYFEPATASALAYYPVTPCRVADTRGGDGALGGPFLNANQERDFPVLASTCIPAGINPPAYSFNVTAVPHPAGQRLGFLTVWPEGQLRPTVSTLNNPTGTIVANAAIVPAGTSGGVAVYPNNTTDLVIDITGYFAPPTSTGQALYILTPCRTLDTRSGGGAFTGELTVDIATGPCGVPATAMGYVLNATVLPQGRLGYLTLWPDGEPQPEVSTLNAVDGAFTSNMAIVSTSNGSIDAFAANGTTNLLLDLSSLMGALPPLTIPAQTLPGGNTGQSYQAQLAASGGEPPYSWTVTTGSLPPGLTLSAAGLISGTPTGGGTFSFTVQVADALTNMATANLSITVSSLLAVTTTSLPDGTVMVPYDATLGATGGVPPYSWTITNGALPAGLSLNPNTGLISGTPLAAQVSIFTVQVQDSQLHTAQATVQIVINASTTNGALNGHYAFSFNGYSNGKAFYMAGSFVADGAGHVITGVLDFNNGAGSPPQGFALAGTYNVTANGLGTMTLNVATLGAMNFHLSVSNGGNGALIQDNADPANRGSGVFFVQTTEDFGLPPLGGYAVGTFGADQNFNRYAKGGAFQVTAGGTITGGSEDLNDNGTLSNRIFSGHFFSPGPQTGRGQVSLSFPHGVTNNYAYYIVSKSQYILLGTDPLSSLDPLTLASILAQATSGFNNSSLNGVSVYEVNGLAPNGGTPVSDAVLGFFNANGTGSATLNFDENNGGTITQQQVAQGAYTVATSGKVTLTGFVGTPPIVYLVNANQGFVVGQDSSVASGILEPQTAPPPFTNVSILGTYLGATTAPVETSIVDAVSFLFADGNGNINGIEDYSGPSGSGTQNIAATYQVDSTGRAVLTGTPAGFAYVVATKKVVLLPTGNAPALSAFNLGLTN